MDSRGQLTFWPVSSDEWSVSSSPSAKGNPIRRDEIIVTNEWTTPAHWASGFNIVLFVGGPDWSTAEPHGPPEMWWKFRGVSKLIGRRAALAAFIAPLFDQSGDSSLEWLSPEQCFAVSRVIIRDMKSGRTLAHTKSLASSLKRISHEAIRQDLMQAWTRVLARVPDQPEEILEETPSGEQPDHFIPSAALVEMVREGLRSYSENYSRLVEPRFIEAGLSLLRDEDIKEFVGTRMWRLVLSLADRAAAEGKNWLQLGTKDGFLDQFDHLILDRIPVSPKHVTPFLNTLYGEYKRFAAGGLELPSRGTLWADEYGLYCRFEELTTPDLVGNQETEVSFE